MPNRERKIPIQIYLSEDEDYILTQKQKASGMKSKSSFLRHLFYTVMSLTLTIQSFGNTTQPSHASVTV